MELSSSLVAGISGALCGIISGFGIGGGSLLMVWMTAVIALDQKTAQGIKLLYFLPTSVGALIFHIKNKMICWNAVIPAALFGSITAAISAYFSTSMNVEVLRKLFGAFLIFVGIKEIFNKKKRSQK